MPVLGLRGGVFCDYSFFIYRKPRFLSGIHLNTWKYNVNIITLENKSVALAWNLGLVYVKVFGK